MSGRRRVLPLALAVAAATVPAFAGGVKAFAAPEQPDVGRATPARGASAVASPRPRERSAVTRAVWARGRLWMRSEAREVFSVAEGEPAARTEPLPEPALDLCVDRGRDHVLTAGASRSTLRRWAGGAWRAVATLTRHASTGPPGTMVVAR